MKIISYNVNGIRSAIKKGFLEWVKSNHFDIICIQETKAQLDQIDTKSVEQIGYKWYNFSAHKKGYSGVAIMSKHPIDNVHIGTNINWQDIEGRTIRIDIGNTTIVNTYFPSGSSGDARQAMKMTFLDEYFDFINQLRQHRPQLIVCGDYNICHRPIDIHNPIANKNTSGFKPEERAWMDKWFANGFIDTFRHINPSPHQYSWWSYRANARARNKGWRIDYITVSSSLEKNIKHADILQNIVHSDHCPVYLDIDL